MNMKLIFQEFHCPECGQIRLLKIRNICADCRDKMLLEEIAQNRKLSTNLYHEVFV